MAENRGKKFEQIIKDAFEKVDGVSIDRVHDQTTRYYGSSNICDFIVYKHPHQYYIECKSVHGNTLSIHSIPKKDKKGALRGFYGNISDSQWNGLIAKSKIPGVIAGVLCWWIDKDVTKFIPIQTLQILRDNKYKSVSYNLDALPTVEIKGKKKRVFFDYDMAKFFTNVAYEYKLNNRR